MSVLFLAIVALAEAGATPTTTNVQPPAADGACQWWLRGALRVTVPVRHGGTVETMLSDTVSRGWTRIASCLREQAKLMSTSAPEYDCVPPHGPFVVAVTYGRVVSYHLDEIRGSGEVTLELPNAIAHWRANCQAPHTGASTTTKEGHP